MEEDCKALELAQAHSQPGHAVAAEGIGTELGHQDIGVIGVEKGADHLVQHLLICIVARPGQEGDVHRVAAAGLLTDLIDKPAPWEDCVPTLVDRDRQYAICRVEGILDPVSVMGIDVHIRNPLFVREESVDGKDNVVYVTEARGLGGHGVVQPP